MLTAPAGDPKTPTGNHMTAVVESKRPLSTNNIDLTAAIMYEWDGAGAARVR